MKQEYLIATKNKTFETCKKVLNDLNYSIVYENYHLGEIQAEKGGAILTFGHKIIIEIKKYNEITTTIFVKSNTIGIQIIDWGTNKENENELIELISKNIV